MPRHYNLCQHTARTPVYDFQMAVLLHMWCCYCTSAQMHAVLVPETSVSSMQTGMPAKRSIDLVSMHYKGCNQGQRGTCTRSVEQAQE